MVGIKVGVSVQTVIAAVIPLPSAMQKVSQGAVDTFEVVGEPHKVVEQFQHWQRVLV